MCIRDRLSDVLGNGRSSRLYQRLLKEQQLFGQIDAYLTGQIDPGLLVIDGKPSKDISLEQAEDAIWKELEILKNEKISERELEKLKNKIESSLAFSEVNVLNKAINLAFFELLGDANLINSEAIAYQNVTIDDIQRVAREIFSKENCSELYYRATKIDA